MTVFENVRVEKAELKVNAYVDDKGPAHRLVIPKFGTSCCHYTKEMLIDKDIRYLMAAVNNKLVTTGQTVKVMDGAPGEFDPAYIEAG